MSESVGRARLLLDDLWCDLVSAGADSPSVPGLSLTVDDTDLARDKVSALNVSCALVFPENYSYIDDWT